MSEYVKGLLVGVGGMLVIGIVVVGILALIVKWGAYNDDSEIDE